MFGYNTLVIKNKSKSFVISFNPSDSLEFINFDKRNQYLISEAVPEQVIPLNNINLIPDRVLVKNSKFWKNKSLPEGSIF